MACAPDSRNENGVMFEDCGQCKCNEVPSAGDDTKSDKLKFRTGPAGQMPPQEVNGAPEHNIIVLFIMFSLLLSAMWGDLTAPVPVALRANAGDSRRGRVHRAARENPSAGTSSES